MKIVYLKPKSGFKALLRSDTLWGNICWAVRMVYGENELEKMIENQSFTISSTFPYVEKNGEKIALFPTPMIIGEPKSAPTNASYDELAKWMTTRKKEKKRNTLISQILFEKLINGEVTIDSLDEQILLPSIKSNAVTRNKIDRLQGGTYKADGESGQLFHVDEFHVVGSDEEASYGLYFLAQGHTTMLEGALRLLHHIGIGGDRNVGKGNFSIDIQDFSLRIPANPSAVTNLSMLFPTEDEIAHFSKDKEKTSYQLEVRQGKLGFLNFKNVQKSPLLYFKEGSVLPYIQNHQYGQNPKVATSTKLDFQVVQYGQGFMIPMNI